MKRIDIICEEETVHTETLAAVRTLMPTESRTFALADFFKAFADSSRVRILYALDKHEMCVCDIAALLGISVSAVSHQLRFLRDARLVRFRREGKTVFYSLADGHVSSIIQCGMDHICE